MKPSPAAERSFRVTSAAVGHPAKSIYHLPWHNLRALKLCHRVNYSHGRDIITDVRTSGRYVVGFLARCINLEYLCLRLMLDPEEQFLYLKYPFLRELCCEYKAMGGKPLNLKVLDLGSMLDLEACGEGGKVTGMKAYYLRYLTNTEKLEELWLWFFHECKVAWGEISPTSMLNLKCLHVGELGPQGYNYFQTPEMAIFLRRIHLSIIRPKTHLCRPFRDAFAPYRRRSYFIFNLRLGGIHSQSSLRTLGLAVDFTGLDSSQRRCILAAPWSWLKWFKVLLPIDKAFLSRVANTFIQNMAELEALCVEFKALDKSTDNDNEIDEHRLEHVARLAARKCPKLEFVSFHSAHHTMSLFKNRMRTYKVFRTTTRKVEIVELDRAVAEKAIPKVFWLEGTKMSQFASEGPF